MTCGAPGCDASLAGRRKGSKFCSKVCNDEAQRFKRLAAKAGVTPEEYHGRIAGRTCASPECDAGLDGMRRHAKFCSRRCKTRADAIARREDGRARAADRARYEREAGHRKAYARRYLQENPERMRNIRRKRKSRIRYESKLVTERDWQRLVVRYRGCCAYCGKKDDNLHREHVVPLSRGGRHSIGNLLPACAGCNLSKHSSFVAEWKQRIGGDFTP